MTSIKPDQLTFPIDTIQAQLKIHGIYSIPDEWKATDQANPGLFTYTVRMSKFQILKGKVAPRQLTQKEKRQQQQKNKKGGKKDSKNPQPNEQQQKIKKAEQQRQRQRQQLFAKLSEEEQFYHTAQDIYRSPFLKFQENNSSAVFKGNDCLIFEQRLLKNKGDWIYIYKLPAVSEDELAKMRKSKPKTLNNINDLNPVVMRAWVNFEQLSSSNDKIQLKQLRCKIAQVDKTPQTSEPNLERTYIKISFTLNEPVIREKDSYSTSSLIADPQKPKEVLPEIKCLQEMKEELALAVESLAMEYSTMFWKQINMQQQQRNSQIYLNNKKGQLTKRKEQFLYDFNVTGKYKILKDRIKKCIVHLCQTKYKDFFAGMKSFNGIKCNNQDQIYSQIYNLLVSSYQETLFKIIHEKQQSLGEILVLNNETIKQERQQLLSSYKDETVIDRVKRSIKEYEVLQNFGYGESLIQKYIEEYPELTELKYIYGTYCLKFNLKPAKELLPYIEEYLTKQKFTLTDDKKLEFMLILLNIGGENNLKGWIILREIIQVQISSSKDKPSQSLSKWLLLASVVLKSIGNAQLSSKYRSFALREYKKYLGSLSSQVAQSTQSNHKESPQKSQIPSISGMASYGEVGSGDQLNKLFDGLIEVLNRFSAFELIKRILAEKSSGQSKEQSSEQTEITLEKALPEINELLVSHTQEARSKLLELTLKLYQTASVSGTASQKNTILELILKAYLLKLQSSPNKNPQDLTALQTYLKKCIMTNNEPLSRFTSLLRLGYVYCQKQQFGNARACLLKYLQKANQFPQYLSGLSYKILGIACMKSGRVNEAIENFKHWNLSDPKNKNSWLYLALGFAQSKQLIPLNQCLTQYKKRSHDQPTTEQQTQVLSQISQSVGSLNSCGQYQTVIKDKIVQAIVC